MARIRDRRIAMQRRPGPVCPRIAKILSNNFDKSQGMVCTWNGGDEFEVNAYGHQLVVNTFTRECTCRLWQLTGIPCAHSIPCLLKKKIIPMDLVDACYHVITFMRVYENVLHPVNGPEFWENLDGMELAPPECVRLAGRPKKSRNKSADEIVERDGKNCVKKRGAQKCSICKEEGHKRTTCPNNPDSNAAKKVTFLNWWLHNCYLIIEVHVFGYFAEETTNCCRWSFR